MEMTSTTLSTKRSTLRSTGKEGASRISTKLSNTRDNNNIINSSKTRGDTCNNNSKVDLKGKEVNIQANKQME